MKCLSAAGILRSLGYHENGLPLTTRVLIIKTFVIQRLTYGLPTYPKLGVSRADLKKTHSLILG